MAAPATIGVYGWTLDRFLEALRRADVRLVLDVRQRRGVRGSEYAWANAVRLQAALTEAGIEYRHGKELAPTTELRQLQYREDDRLGVGKRSRVELAPEYRERYLKEILDKVELGPVFAELLTDAFSALLCVERDPEACHRHSSRSGWRTSTACRCFTSDHSGDSRLGLLLELVHEEQRLSLLR